MPSLFRKQPSLPAWVFGDPALSCLLVNKKYGDRFSCFECHLLPWCIELRAHNGLPNEVCTPVSRRFVGQHAATKARITNIGGMSRFTACLHCFVALRRMLRDTPIFMHFPCQFRPCNPPLPGRWRQSQPQFRPSMWRTTYAGIRGIRRTFHRSPQHPLAR